VRILASLLHDPTPSNILAECGWQELAERFASYRLELHPEKTRLLRTKLHQCSRVLGNWRATNTPRIHTLGVISLTRVRSRSQ
jgi:hypothetical protein